VIGRVRVPPPLIATARRRCPPLSHSLPPAPPRVRAPAAAVRADIAMRNERSQGWGTVIFSSPAEASKAIREFHKALVNDRESEEGEERRGRVSECPASCSVVGASAANTSLPAQPRSFSLSQSRSGWTAARLSAAKRASGRGGGAPTTSAAAARAPMRARGGGERNRAHVQQ